MRPVSSAVAARPGVVVVVAILLTALLGSFASQEVTNDQAAFSPETPEVLAQQELGDRFTTADTATIQVIVRGDDVVSADGVATVTAVREQAVDSFGDALADGGQQPAVLSFLLPAQQAAAASGTDLATADDAAVDTLQEQALAGPPAGGAGEAPSAGEAPAPDGAGTQAPAPAQGQAPPGGGQQGGVGGLAASLLSGEPTDSPTGLVLVTLDRSGYDGQEQLIEAQTAFADALAATDLPLEVIPFSFELIADPGEDFQAEIGRLFGLASLVIIVVLAFVFRARRGPSLGAGGALRRSAADMALSMLMVVMAIGWSQGLFGLLGPDYLGLVGEPSPPTQIIPILLLALGVSYAIHGQSRYREELNQGDATRSPTEAARRLGPTVGVALLLSMLTTGIGFLTNLSSPIPAIADLGVIAAVGIVSVFLLATTFLPASRLLLDRLAERRGNLARTEVAPEEGSALARVGTIGLVPALRAPTAVLGISAVLAAAGGYGLSTLSTEFSFTAFLPEDSPAIEALEVLEEDFGGGLAESTSVLVTGDVLTPEVHAAVAGFADRLEGADGIVELGDGPAVTTPVTELSLAQQIAASPEQQDAVAAATADGLAPDGTIAPDGDVASVYAGMAAVFPNVAGVVDAGEADPAVRLSVRSQSDAVGSEVVAANVDDAVQPLRDAGAETVVTSDAIIFDGIINGLSSSQVTGLVVTLVSVMALLALVYGLRDRRPLLGVLVMLPVAVVVLWVFGLMALFGIPFDPVTAIISSLVIGVGVDFCIHLGERFVKDAEEADGDVAVALKQALRHTGAALAGAGLTTLLGFFVLVFASIVPFQRLGIVTVFAIGGALVATLMVLPPILVLYGRWRFDGPSEPDPQRRELASEFVA